MADFKIGNREYEYEMPVKTTDPLLIERLTGMKYKAWLEQAQEEHRAQEEAKELGVEGDDYSYTTLLGLMACGVARGNPQWPADHTIKFLSQIDFDKIEQLVSPDEIKANVPDEEGEQDGPPAEKATPGNPS